MHIIIANEVTYYSSDWYKLMFIEALLRVVLREKSLLSPVTVNDGHKCFVSSDQLYSDEATVYSLRRNSLQH